MKTFIAVFCCSLSFSAFAQMAIPSVSTYSIVSGVVENALGEPDDDPQEPVSLTTTEISTVTSALAQADANIKQKWLKRRQGADARALINPQLTK